MKVKGTEAIVRGIEYVAAAILAVATLNVFFGGVLRYTLSIGIPDSNDFGKMMLGIVVFCGIGVVGLRGGHIVVTAAADIMPSPLRRLVVFLADIVTFASMAFLSWTLLKKSFSARKEHLSSYDLGAPLWGFYLAAAIGLALGTIVYLYVILKRRGREVDHEEAQAEGVNL